MLNLRRTRSEIVAASLHTDRAVARELIEDGLIDEHNHVDLAVDPFDNMRPSDGGMNVSESPRKATPGWAPSGLQIPPQQAQSGAEGLMRCPSPNVNSPAHRFKDGRWHAGLVTSTSPQCLLSSDEYPASPHDMLDSPLLTPLFEKSGIYRQGRAPDRFPSDRHPGGLQESSPTPTYRAAVLQMNWNDTPCVPTSPAQRIRHSMLACSTQGLRSPHGSSCSLNLSPWHTSGPMGDHSSRSTGDHLSLQQEPPTSPSPALSPSSA